MAVFLALTAHFGQWMPIPGKRWLVWQVDPRLLYGQLHKVKSGYRLKHLYTQGAPVKGSSYRGA